MESGSSEVRRYQRVRRGPPALRAESAGGESGQSAGEKDDVINHPEAIFQRMEAVQSHPLAELLECPPEARDLLNVAARCIDVDSGQIVFRQSDACLGLYLVISGQFQRRTERLATRLTLGSARAGDLLELAATLSEGRHTYTLCAQTPGSVVLLPMEVLRQAFQNYPPMRMRLLEELAREVSRAYLTCCLSRTVRERRHGEAAELT
ncbi:MAG: Crp/Fnr family transcriptional regulator [Terracidiphilus sp.]|jgi:CRP-like cAMP-binding protein